MKKWYNNIPHAVTMLFVIIVLVTVMTYLIPAGLYERILVDGRTRVVAGSYHRVPSSPLSLMEMFKAIPAGFKTASDIIFIVLAGAIMFGVMEKSKAVENAVGTLVRKLGLKRKYLIVIILTFVFGLLGVAVGYENNIALVPIAAVVSLALGGDLILAAGMSVGAMTIGFGLSPINPYTVGTGHKIAELSMFSGWELRTVLCFVALSLMAFYNIHYFKKLSNNPSSSLGGDLNENGFILSQPLDSYIIDFKSWLVIATFVGGLLISLYGVFNYGWYINELSAIFLMVALVSGIISGMNGDIISKTLLDSVAKAAPGAFMVGFATTIKVIMDEGQIGDTISYYLSEILQGLPLYASAISMSLSQCVMNLFIPSGSGQALATLPVMIPLGEVLGLTRQSTILAFQIGDGVTNLVNPTLGGLIAMLSMCRVPLDRWLRFIFPIVIPVLLLSWIVLILGVLFGY